MKITVINGTEIRGCTYNIKESFLEDFRGENEITEFYLPKDLPNFCSGCKNCFFKGEEFCPHAEYVMPIWKSILDSDLLLFTSPVYALRTTGQMKSLLDHLCVYWMVHRPNEKMFSKRAVIVTNAVGILNGGAQRDIETSLSWLGVTDIKKFGIGLLEGVIWKDLSIKRREIIIRKTKKFAKRCKKYGKAHKGISVRIKFAISRIMHKTTLKKEKNLCLDNKYWIDKGWM